MDNSSQEQMLRLFGEYRNAEGADSWLNLETKRFIDNVDLIEAILRAAYPDVTLVVAGHHLMFIRHNHPLPYEVASVDTLIFDHDIAKRVWGENWQYILRVLVTTPVPRRDEMLRQFFSERSI